jgi:hypothetical protein
MISERVPCTHPELSSPESSDMVPMQLRGSNILLVHFCVGIGDMLTTQSEMMAYSSLVYDDLLGSTEYACYLEQS